MIGRRTAVVGGGLAGTAAALARADRGDRVTLLESRPRLGGLAGSFSRGDRPVDSGQHVFLRCCTSYRALLDRLGVADQVVLQDRMSIPVLRPGPAGRPVRATLRRTAGPAPLALGRMLAGHRLLSPADRVRAARAGLALRQLDPADPAVDAQTFAAWLTAHGQNDRTVAALWDLIGVAALNAPATGASLALAGTVFRTALLDDPAGADIGWAEAPLGELHGTAARRALEEAGCRVRTGARVQALRAAGDGWVVTQRDGTEHEVDAVVLAAPPAVVEDLLPAGAVPLAPGWAGRLGAVPIVNVHLHYDRPVLDVPFLAAVGSPVQWVFDRTASAGVHSGQYLVISLSAAQETVRTRAAALTAQMEAALADLLPAARSARVLDGFVTREPAATVDPAPGQADRRPAAVTTRPGLVLAGAWTATGWPSTMEGAVRSGETAARVLDERAGAQQDRADAVGAA
ncbi:hydroxysqualene dehydroxylase HpnE [Modestobacter sp. VKM Ac-2983]|uniref:hydroxysqualene dehydroxylase HpnE n=1 Tax=Modestobacter sp. VKM Ac-2983 TaxID=3004137 RepID=UPI0022ABC483|nr:hydroxysqualene dehydroxylase HpnE [Modestobacter sp. VKM Ac-2983]MCZ2805412.1 hydroxysqualene dehydroxylase HpnE [Modestobacter sp. VKM Ac-2983]